MTRVLVVGVPRSGSTWAAGVLGRTPGAVYVHEPDGDHDPFAFRARRGHAVSPMLAPGDRAPDLERLWGGVFAGGAPSRAPAARLARFLYARTSVDERWAVWLGGRPSPALRVASMLAAPRTAVAGARHVVAKSVRAELCAEWIAERFDPHVLVIERDPMNVLASWIELDYLGDRREMLSVAPYARNRWGIEPPGPDTSRLEWQAFYFGVLSGALRDAADRHPEWTRVSHEDLCVDTVARFRKLASDLGLEWGEEVERFVVDSDRAGSGYETRRRAADQPDRWRERLEPAQVETIRRVLARFPAASPPAP
jgi:hypothetical protein